MTYILPFAGVSGSTKLMETSPLDVYL